MDVEDRFKSKIQSKNNQNPIFFRYSFDGKRKKMDICNIVEPAKPLNNAQIGRSFFKWYLANDK